MSDKPIATKKRGKIAGTIHELGRRHVVAVGAVYFVVAWLLVQIAAVVLPSFDAPDWIMRAIIIATVVGFPVAIIFSWIFNITPAGIVRASEKSTVLNDEDNDEDKHAQTERTTKTVRTKQGSNENSKVVAVLPFVNRSERAEDGFFTDGIHDELLMHISKLSAIKVISRTSVMRYRNTQEPIAKVASELGAAVVLEGAVQRAGNRVRIIVQLIDGYDDVHLWAETFDRELTTENLFDIQSEITRLIATQLQAALTSEDEVLLNEAAPTQSLAAYDDYLRGQLLARSEAAGEDEFRQAIKAFDSAIAKDANYAEPQAGKARAQLTLYWFYGWNPEWVVLAEQAVACAKSLHADSIETLLAEAYFHYWGKLEYSQAEVALEQVLSKAPNNSEAWACLAYVIRRAGRFDESIDALEKAYRLDPMLIDLPMELAIALAAFGRFDEAHVYLDRVKQLDPNSAFTAYYVGDVGYLQGKPEEAWLGANHDVDKADFVYCYRRVFHAINTRDEQKIMHAINTWPQELHRTDSFPATFEILKAMALVSLGRENDVHSVLQTIQQIMDALPEPYPGDWRPDAPYFPVTVPGIMGDLQLVREVATRYEQGAPEDQFGVINHYHAFATAFAQCGDRAAALDYLEKLVSVFGPAAFFAISITPAYDELRNESRYLALKENALISESLSVQASG